MKYFFKLNVVSILYALMFFIPFELMLNIYRISRLTNWEINTVNFLIGVTVIIELIGGTTLLLIVNRKWLEGRKADFWTTILWLPYLFLFIYGFALLFPISYRGDVPNPATGLLAIGGVIIYPFYILLLKFLSMENERRS